MHTVLWGSGDLDALPPSDTFVATQQEPDTLDVFGACAESLSSTSDSRLRLNQHPTALAGFIRDAEEFAVPSDAPMIGFFRRKVKAGQLESLSSSFQEVCDRWYPKIPGMLAAVVYADSTSNYSMFNSGESRSESEIWVWDLRIFADAASYAAHVDKSDADLTCAMEKWFGNYDSKEAHTGCLYKAGEDLGNVKAQGSSIKTADGSGKEATVKLAFQVFHYGSAGMVGEVPKIPSARR